MFEINIRHTIFNNSIIFTKMIILIQFSHPFTCFLLPDKLIYEHIKLLKVLSQHHTNYSS